MTNQYVLKLAAYCGAVLLLAGACGRRPAAPSSDDIRRAHHDRQDVSLIANGDSQTPTPLSDEAIQQRLADMDRAIEASPGDGALIDEKLHYALAYAPAAAVEQCLALLESDASNAEAMTHLAGGYIGLGRLDLALHWAGQALAVRDDADTRLLIADIRLLRGERSAAAAEFQRVLAMDPANVRAADGLKRSSGANTPDHRHRDDLHRR